MDSQSRFPGKTRRLQSTKRVTYMGNFRSHRPEPLAQSTGPPPARAPLTSTPRPPGGADPGGVTWGSRQEHVPGHTGMTGWGSRPGWGSGSKSPNGAGVGVATLSPPRNAAVPTSAGRKHRPLGRACALPIQPRPAHAPSALSPGPRERVRPSRVGG